MSSHGLLDSGLLALLTVLYVFLFYSIEKKLKVIDERLKVIEKKMNPGE